MLTNIVLPYAMTQMTENGMDTDYRDIMTAEAVAPVVTALVDPTSTLNGQIIVTAAGAMRAATAVEFGTVRLPGAGLTPVQLGELITESRAGASHEYPEALTAFRDFAREIVDG